MYQNIHSNRRSIEAPNLRRVLSRATLATLLVCAAPQFAQATGIVAGQAQASAKPLSTQATLRRQDETPRIQLAILLDTSSSMDGLIDQTRNQIWQVVNEFAGAKQDGITPILEIALFEYGNNNNPLENGYLRMLNGFTRELDQVSEGLFSLTTNGGSEFCGYAIRAAVDMLQWSHSSSDIKTIFIAGNEAFSQGPVDYREAISLARRHGVSVNTIHAGDYQQGVDGGWKSGALLAGGDYMSIDANRSIVHLAAPQDAKIAELNARLNGTYLAYGGKGREKAQRQLEQDSLSDQISGALLSKRAESKASSFYRNSDWDLVDALSDGALAEEQLTELKDQALPEAMQGLSSAKKLEYVRDMAEERLRIKREIFELSADRKAYIAARERGKSNAAPSMGDAISETVRKEALRKNFTLGQN